MWCEACLREGASGPTRAPLADKGYLAGVSFRVEGSCFPESLGRKKGAGEEWRLRDGGQGALSWLRLPRASRSAPAHRTITPNSRRIRWVTTQAKMKAVRKERGEDEA